MQLGQCARSFYQQIKHIMLGLLPTGCMCIASVFFIAEGTNRGDEALVDAFSAVRPRCRSDVLQEPKHEASGSALSNPGVRKETQ